MARSSQRPRGIGLTEQYPIEIVDVDRALALDAARLKDRRRVSFADCLVISLARQLNVAVVTGDADFRQVEDLVPIEWLPSASAQ